jgi:hypothetical protein
MKEPADLTFHVDPIEVSTIHDRTTVFDGHMKRPPDSALVIWGPFLTFDAATGTTRSARRRRAWSSSRSSAASPPRRSSREG